MFLTNAGTLPLGDPEESRCALIVQGMMQGGDWIVPHLEGEIYADKPAPFFWLSAAGWKLTGNAELGGRLVAALAGTLAVLVTYVLGRRMFGAKAGLLAGLVLATSGEFVYLARWYRMDMPFAAAMWAAVWWFWRAEDRRWKGGGEQDRRGWWGFYALCGIATLFKGPAGLVLPGLVVVAYLLLSGRPRRVLEMLHPGGIVVYLVIAAPWYVAMIWQDPGYAWYFFVTQNVVRYAGRSLGQHSFLGILYVPIVLVGMLPWAFLAPAMCVRYFPWRLSQRTREPGMMLLWLAALVPLVFFAFSKTKLLGYILPVFAPLAVMVGVLVTRWIEGKERDRLAEVSVWSWLAGLAVQLAVLGGVEKWLGVLDGWYVMIAMAGAAGIVGTWWLIRRGRRVEAVAAAMVLVVAAYLFIIIHTGPAGYELLSTRSLANLVSAEDAETCDFYFVTKKKLSFLFYVQPRSVKKVEVSEPGTFEELAEAMQGEQKTYCLLSQAGDLERMMRDCPGKVYVVGESGGRWLVVNQRP